MNPIDRILFCPEFRAMRSAARRARALQRRLSQPAWTEEMLASLIDAARWTEVHGYMTDDPISVDGERIWDALAVEPTAEADEYDEIALVDGREIRIPQPPTVGYFFPDGSGIIPHFSSDYSEAWTICPADGTLGTESRIERRGRNRTTK